MYTTKRERIVALSITSLLFLVSLFIFIYPIYWLLTISMKSQIEAFRTPPSWFFIPTFDHYIRLFAQADFMRYFINSISVSFGATCLALLLGIPAAYSLSRGNFKGKNKVLFAILASQMVPPILFIIPYFMAFVRFKLIDTRIGLIIISLSFTLALVTWSMRAFFDDIPVQLEEAARIDGASDLQTFARVVLPLVTTGAVAAGIISMILCWNQFLFPLVLTRRRAITATVALMKFIASEAEDWGLMASGSIVLTLPVLFFSIMIRKYLAHGLVTGALKG
jgi:multiple sugar transport system permease protein